MNHQQNLDRFYELLSTLGKKLADVRILSACHGKLRWPTRGVYFFFEPGEFRHNSSKQARVVRVGTHAVSKGSKTTLWTRLRAHRGSKNRGGNHRGSVFRRHVGNAMLARDPNPAMPYWGIRASAPREVRQGETGLEQKVSEYLGQMPVLWLAVDDEPNKQSKRGYVERNAVGLLTSVAPVVDAPAKSWLGNLSPERAIRTSGIWNLNYVGDPYDPSFLDVMDGLVAETASARCA